MHFAHNSLEKCEKPHTNSVEVYLNDFRRIRMQAKMGVTLTICQYGKDRRTVFLCKKIAEFAIILELNGYSDCLKIG